MQKLSWKEKYAGILVLFISIIFLLMQVMASFGESARAYSIQNGTFVINKNEFFSDLRTYSVILAGIIAGWCLLKGKRLGYILGLPILLGILTLSISMSVEQAMIVKKIYNPKMWYGYGVGILLVLLAVIFLLLPAARQRYRVNKMVFLLTLLLFAGLAGAYIYLQ